jgi:hypothetical protein
MVNLNTNKNATINTDMIYNNNSYKTSEVFTSIRNTEYKNLNHSYNKFPHNSCNYVENNMCKENIQLYCA